MIEGHGDDLWRYGSRIRHNFSSNIYASFDHGKLMRELMTDPAVLSSYPEPSPVSLEEALSSGKGCRKDEVMVTNGATEAIYIIAHRYEGMRSVILSPTFSEYNDACTIHRHDISLIANITAMRVETDIVWICNPNNPTGKVFPKDYLIKIIDSNPGKVFVIDQAYSDYTSKPVLTAADATGRENVILLGSMTKRFGVPGLRIGYAVACGTIIAELSKLRMPWSVNSAAIKGGLYLLAHEEDYQIDSGFLNSEALRISEELKRLGVSVLPTDCNFLLCELPHGTAADLKKYLIEEEGVLIRDASNFQFLSPAHFRIAVQSPAENDLLLKTVSKWLDI